MTLNRNPDNFFAQIEQAAFEPSALVPGIGFSPDKMLLGRAFSYSDTHRYRIGPNYLQLPVNRPRVEANTYTFDGPMAYEHTRRRPGLRAELLRARRTPTSSARSTTLGGRRRDGPPGLHPARGRRRLLAGRHAGPRGLERRAARALRRRPSPATCSVASRATCSSGPSQYWRSVDADIGKRIEEIVREGADLGAPGAQPDDAQDDAATRSSSRRRTRTSRAHRTGHRARSWQDLAMAEPDVSVVTDVLGAPYAAETLELRPDDEGEVVATLVQPTARTRRPARRCCTCTASPTTSSRPPPPTSGASAGYDFYALDLRKYGRSLRPHQTPNYVADLTAYYEELDDASRSRADGHDHVVLSAHSTGGLTVPLWLLDRRSAELAGIVLNARGSTCTATRSPAHLATAGDPPGRRPSARRARSRAKVSGFYARSLHRDHDGEWDFNLDWKPLAVLAGVRRLDPRDPRRAQSRSLAGSTSRRRCSSSAPTGPGPPRTSRTRPSTATDIVLDVEQMRRRAPLLGRHVTIAQVDGGDARRDAVARARPGGRLRRGGAVSPAYVDG